MNTQLTLNFNLTINLGGVGDRPAPRRAGLRPVKCIEGEALEAWDARDVLSDLAQHFKVSAPALEWNTRTSRGLYYPGRQKIIAGPKTWTGVETTLIHEFSHHLNSSRGGRKHDGNFWKTLVEVVIAWYGDPALYSWRSEYKTGQKLAQSRGWRR